MSKKRNKCVSAYLNDELSAKLGKFAESLSLTQSSAVKVILAEKLNKKED